MLCESRADFVQVKSSACASGILYIDLSCIASQLDPALIKLRRVSLVRLFRSTSRKTEVAATAFAGRVVPEDLTKDTSRLYKAPSIMGQLSLVRWFHNT